MGYELMIMDAVSRTASICRVVRFVMADGALQPQRLR